MKKRFIVFLLVLITSVVSVFAQEQKITNFDPEKILVVGKITLIYDENPDFIRQTRGIPDADAEKPITYSLPYVYDSGDTFGNNSSRYYKENKTTYENGEFFMVQYKKLKDSSVLNYSSSIPVCFFGSDKAKLYLPFSFLVDVPDDIKILYLGSFEFHVTGDNFTIDAAQRVDEYDLAQEELDIELGTHYDMARAVLREKPTITEEDIADAK